MRNVNLQLVADYTMGSGVGSLPDHTACVMSQAAILDALERGETITKLTDELDCCCPVLRTLAICLNDVGWWASDAERTEKLRPLIPLLLDSRVSPVSIANRAALASVFAKWAAESAEKSAQSAESAEWAEKSAESAKWAAESAAKSAESAESAEKSAQSAESAEWAAKSAESAESAEKSAKLAAKSAKWAAESAAKWAESLVPLRDELLRTFLACEQIKDEANNA